MENKTLKVLIGDDQIGVEGSPSRKAFEYNYSGLPVEFVYEADPNKVVDMAKSGEFDAIVTDYDYKSDTTGLDVLRELKGLEAVVVFHTSTEDVRGQGHACGASYCVPKGLAPDEFLSVLEGKRAKFADVEELYQEMMRLWSCELPDKFYDQEKKLPHSLFFWPEWSDGMNLGEYLESPQVKEFIKYTKEISTEDASELDNELQSILQTRIKSKSQQMENCNAMFESNKTVSRLEDFSDWSTSENYCTNNFRCFFGYNGAKSGEDGEYIDGHSLMWQVIIPHFLNQKLDGLWTRVCTERKEDVKTILKYKHEHLLANCPIEGNQDELYRDALRNKIIQAETAVEMGFIDKMQMPSIEQIEIEVRANPLPQSRSKYHGALNRVSYALYKGGVPEKFILQ